MGSDFAGAAAAACACVAALLLACFLWMRRRRQRNLLPAHQPFVPPQQQQAAAPAQPPAYAPPNQATTAVWEWQDAPPGGGVGPWRRYDAITSQRLEEQHTQGNRSHVFTNAGGTYSVDIASMTQKNIDTEFTRRVRRTGGASPPPYPHAQPQLQASAPPQQQLASAPPPQALTAAHASPLQAQDQPAHGGSSRTFRTSEFKAAYDRIPKNTVDLERLFRSVAQLAAGHCRAHGVDAAAAERHGERFAGSKRHKKPSARIACDLNFA